MNDIDIFITAFKPFDEFVKNDVYKIVCVKDYKYEGKLKSYSDNIGDNISDMNSFFNELTVFYWVWKNYDMKDYVGMCSYRRYFDFFDDIDYIKYYLKDYDIILPLGTTTNNINNLEQYDTCHNVNDLMLAINILLEKYPSYKEDVDFVLHNNELYANNMFIMKKEDYIKYCEFLFDILFEYIKRKRF